MVDSLIRVSRIRPITAPRPETAASAANAPTPTETGSSYLMTSDAVSSCERSPHSARKSTMKLVAITFSPWAVAAPLCENSSTVSSSSLSASAAPRSRRKPPMRNMMVANTSTGVRGSLASRPPSRTATTVWTRNAAVTPIHTSSGRKRVASTSVAMNVLSGSSTTKMSPKTMAAVARLNSIARRPYRPACAPARIGCSGATE